MGAESARQSASRYIVLCGLLPRVSLCLREQRRTASPEAAGDQRGVEVGEERLLTSG